MIVKFDKIEWKDVNNILFMYSKIFKTLSK